MQHERKPVLVKKENSNGGSQLVMQQQQQQQQQTQNINSNANSSGAATAVQQTQSSKYARKRDSAGSQQNNGPASYLGLFPGFNFADLQNSLEARQCKF